MNEPQSEQLKDISERVIECWTRIKAKAHARGDITNIEKHAPCITGALNQMEQFLNDYTQEQIRERDANRLRGAKNRKRLAMLGTDGE